MWSQILLILSCSVGIFILSRGFSQKHQDIKKCSVVVLSFVILIELTLFFEYPFQEMATRWLILFASITSLSTMLMIIRSRRPEIVRYPYPFVFTPVILLLVFPLIMEMTVITNLIYLMLQGGAVGAFLFFLIAHYKSVDKAWMGVTSGATLMLAFVIHWFAEELFGGYDVQWVWQFLTAAGIIFASIIVPPLINESELYKQHS